MASCIVPPTRKCAAPLSAFDAQRPNYTCHKWLNGSEYGCLTSARWKQLTQFASANDAKLVFGLNACYGRPAPGRRMDLSNIAHFLTINKQIGVDVYAYQFGNEKLGKYVGVDAYAADTVALITEVLEPLYPDSNERPLLIVPDSDNCMNYSQTHEYLLKVAHGFGTMDLSTHIAAIAFHIYPKCAFDTPTAVWDLHCLNKFNSSMQLWVLLAKQFNISRVLLSETGEQSGGGRQNSTNVWMSSFWYTYALATVASASDKLTTDLFRQSFMGGFYELISHFSAPPSPNPDYWLLFLWKRLVAATALRSDLRSDVHSSERCLRAFAFSAKSAHSDAIAVFINFCKLSTAKVSLPSTQWNSWQLTAPSLTSRSVWLNGELMRLNTDGSFPNPQPRDSGGKGFIVLRPQTITFLNFSSNL